MADALATQFSSKKIANSFEGIWVFLTAKGAEC
jgi:hypothetical protein